MGNHVVAVWLVDGFLHPPATLTHEFTDVDEFLQVPLPGLADIVQFAHIHVDSSSFWCLESLVTTFARC